MLRVLASLLRLVAFDLVDIGLIGRVVRGRRLSQRAGGRWLVFLAPHVEILRMELVAPALLRIARRLP